MNSSFTLRSFWAIAAPVMLAGLASCSQTPETATTTAPVAAPAPSAAPAAAPAPVAAAPASLAASAKVLPKPKAPKHAPAAQPVAAAPAPVVAEAAPAAPAPEPVVAASAAPATHTQAGRVLDESGRPLVGATVLLRGSTKGTSTDANGSYSLEVPNGENTFLVGYGGYEDETATSRDGQPLNVTLLPSPNSKTKGRRARR